MMDLTVKLELVQERESVRGQQYLLCMWKRGGRPVFATCWNEKHFSALKEAHEKGFSIGILVEADAKIDHNGEPYLKVVDLEDPAQTRFI